MTIIRDFEDAPQPPTPLEQPTHRCRVMLTPFQREDVRKRTGRDMAWVDIHDDDGRALEKGMPQRNPDDVLWHALRDAEERNKDDADYHAYLIALAAWQDANKATPAQIADELAEEAEEDAEARAEAFAEFYAAEGAALEAAKAAAVEAWDPKGKKRKKAAAGE